MNNSVLANPRLSCDKANRGSFHEYIKLFGVTWEDLKKIFHF